jgi:HK97 family phage portal protein
MFFKHTANEGIKSYTLDDFLREDDYISEQSLHSPIDLYNIVPTLYRCIDIRAKTIASFPVKYRWRGKEYDPNNEVPQPIRLWHTRIKDYLFYIEASLALTGAAYMIRQTNEYGFNPMPVCIPASDITPYYSTNAFEPDYYRFSAYNVYSEVQPEDIVVIWYPNLTNTRYPGQSPARVALSSADAMANMDTFTTNFFRRGAIKATLLSVGGDNPLATPTREQLSQLETWWSKLVNGVKNAWSTGVTTAQVTPMTVGDGLKDMDFQAIATQKQEEITIAMGVPMALLLPSSSNYATAKEERLSFYMNTLIPEAEFIAEQLNTKFLNEYNVELVFNFKQLEVLQEMETEKAINLQRLVYGGMISVNEAREMLGYSPIEDNEPEDFDYDRPVVEKLVGNKEEDSSFMSIQEETIKRLGVADEHR